METYENEFSNEKITVSFEPKKCIHSDKCARELSEVFKATVIPWIDLEGADSEKIISQIKKCPSGALSFVYNEDLVLNK